MNYKLWLIFLGMCTWECERMCKLRVCVHVRFNHSKEGICSCHIVRMVEQWKVCATASTSAKSRRARTSPGAFQRMRICDQVREGGIEITLHFTYSWLLPYTRPPLSQLLVLALKVSGEFRWTMKTINGVPLPLPSPFPSYPLPEKQDVMDSTSDEHRAAMASLAHHKSFFITAVACTQTMAAYKMYTLMNHLLMVGFLH